MTDATAGYGYTLAAGFSIFLLFVLFILSLSSEMTWDYCCVWVRTLRLLILCTFIRDCYVGARYGLELFLLFQRLVLSAFIRDTLPHGLNVPGRGGSEAAPIFTLLAHVVQCVFACSNQEQVFNCSNLHVRMIPSQQQSLLQQYSSSELAFRDQFTMSM